MGKFIDQNMLNEMGDQHSINLSIRNFGLKKNVPLLKVIPISETKLKGSLFLQDYIKKADYEISLVNDRNFYLQKVENFKQLAISIILFTLFLIALIIFLLNRFILSRVQDLSGKLEEIQNKKDLKARIMLNTGGNDELANLERSINRMLSSLEEKHNEVIKLAYYDQLTKVPNRCLFFEEFNKRIQQNHDSLAILFFDLDGFKWVNDSLGHTIGDALLCRVCERVLPIIEVNDGLLARYGGDEFVILLPSLEKSAIERMAQTVIQEVGREYQVNSFKSFVTASIGISTYPQDGGTVDQLLQKADIAMYEAKRKGKNQIQFYQDLNSLNYGENESQGIPVY